MAVFQSKLSTTSDRFGSNRAKMLASIEQLRELEARAVAASERRRGTFQKRGQLTPRERVSRLIDPGMPYLPLHTLSNYLLSDENPDTSIPGGSVILGIGFVSGVRCLIWADDSGIRAGAATEGGLAAIISAQLIAKRQKLPVIHLVESAGGDLTGYQVEDWARGGAMFRNLSQLSAMGIPVVTILHGPSTAGGAYMPGLSDYVIGIKKNGFAALAGSALVQAATGEIAEEAKLGGAEMHASESGLVEYLAEDDASGIEMARDLVDRWGWNQRLKPKNRVSFLPPRYDPDEIAGLVPADFTTPYEARELIARLVDGSDFEDFKPGYGASLVCVQASIMGIEVGILANNGPIDPPGAQKAAHFIQAIDQSDKPLIFLNNITGYMVGTQYEQAGMIKHGAKMIQAVSNTRSPKISIYVGASYGAGNYGMCGYAYEPDFLFSWPTSTSGVMGGAQAAKTMSLVARARAARDGKKIGAKDLKSQERKIIDHFAMQESAFYTSGRNLDHGIIDPRDTRKVLGFALETVRESRSRDLTPNSFGVARM